jgi:hypothetical protein
MDECKKFSDKCHFYPIPTPISSRSSQGLYIISATDLISPHKYLPPVARLTCQWRKIASSPRRYYLITELATSLASNYHKHKYFRGRHPKSIRIICVCISTVLNLLTHFLRWNKISSSLNCYSSAFVIRWWCVNGMKEKWSELRWLLLKR